jgi:hypothetical protein
VQKTLLKNLSTFSQNFMNIKFRYLLTPLLIGSIAVSCDQKDIEEVVPEGTITSEATSAATSANVIYEETFEGSNPFSTAHSKEIGSWDYALQFVTNPVFAGNKAARFEIREDQPLIKDGKRAEVTIIKGENLPGKNMWYSYAIYFPADYAKDGEQEMINQWYQDRSPATGLRVDDDRIILHTGNTYSPDNRKKIDLGAVEKGKWNTFVFHFIHSNGTDGLIEVWRNGVKVLTHKGGNMYASSIMPKFKMGLYKSAFKYGTSAVDKRVLYFDNIKVGNGNATLAEMDPSAGLTNAPVTPAPTPSEPTPTPTPPAPTEPTPSEPTPTQPAPTTQGVVSFTLVNADTEKDIMTITNGATVNLRTLRASKVNIRANTGSSASGVVKFVLSGADNKTRFDDVAPYALFGDDKKGNYYSWAPKQGSYTLEGTTYTGDKDKLGAATSAAYKISFNIIK